MWKWSAVVDRGLTQNREIRYTGGIRNENRCKQTIKIQKEVFQQLLNNSKKNSRIMKDYTSNADIRPIIHSVLNIVSYVLLSAIHLSSTSIAVSYYGKKFCPL